jgi:hypothetical protein
MGDGDGGTYSFSGCGWCCGLLPLWVGDCFDFGEAVANEGTCLSVINYFISMD